MFCTTTNTIKTVSIFFLKININFIFLFRLIVHVSEFRSDTQPVDESVWHSIASIIPDLKVAVYMLNAHETFRKYSRVLRPGMPLSHLR